jgi:hypothetical protein
MAEEIFEGRRNRLTDVEGRGGVEIKDRIERVRRNLRETTGLEAVLVDFFEDDLRETAASIGELEGFLRRLLVTMEKDGLSADLPEREDAGSTAPITCVMENL